MCLFPSYAPPPRSVAPRLRSLTSGKEAAVSSHIDKLIMESKKSTHNTVSLLSFGKEEFTTLEVGSAGRVQELSHASPSPLPRRTLTSSLTLR